MAEASERVGEGGGALYSARPLLPSTYLLFQDIHNTGIQNGSKMVAEQNHFWITPPFSPPLFFGGGGLPMYRYVTVVWCFIN